MLNIQTSNNDIISKFNQIVFKQYEEKCEFETPQNTYMCSVILQLIDNNLSIKFIINICISDMSQHQRDLHHSKLK